MYDDDDPCDDFNVDLADAEEHHMRNDDNDEQFIEHLDRALWYFAAAQHELAAARDILADERDDELDVSDDGTDDAPT